MNSKFGFFGFTALPILISRAISSVIEVAREILVRLHAAKAANLTVFAVSALLFWSATSKAQQNTELPCGPPVVEVEQERRLHIDPNRPLNIQLGDIKFHVPYAYVYPRPFSTHLNCDPKRGWFGFAFWMPDRGAPEEDVFFQPSYRPAERNRLPGAVDQYIVKVPTLKFNPTPGIDGYGLSPQARVVNLTQLFKNGYRTTHETGGLTRITPIEKPSSHDFWFDIESVNESVLIRCTKGFNAPNPNCQADLYFADLRLELVAVFPRDRLAYWQNIKTALRDMIERWASAG